ncbi:IS3 family transposase [Frankia sp. AgPm24]|uniref:IS3 family transposase n=1 Tax=Frankia sp. AgPm24 TaxID=631128 RepID=UPI0035B3D867
MASSKQEDGEVSSSRGGPRSDRPKRRTFTAAYKKRILNEYDGLTGAGERGALLRREGLYHSHIQKWREAQEQGAREALEGRPAGRPAAAETDADNERLRRENERLTAELARTKAALEVGGKSARALGTDLRERGFRQETRQIVDEAFTSLVPLTSVKVACDLLGLSRATMYRRRHPTPSTDIPSRTPAVHPAALDDTERERLLELLNSDRFVDKSAAQVWATLLDEGVYLASVSTMYRLLRARAQTVERRAQATHPARKKPELLATRPNEIWSWDITKLTGPARGVYFDLYVILDIFSRKAIHFEVHPTENGELAKAFLEHAVAANGRVRPIAVHADRGTSMTSQPVAALLAYLNIDQSHSRPHVSNDNPYSEAQFKTLKYCPAFPGRFGSLQDARVFCDVFFAYYNNEHRHSGIALHTPASVHDGTAHEIQARRAQVLDAAYAAHPERFHRRPTPPALPTRAWINQPPAIIETEEALPTNQAA